ncbi:MAG: PRTRC system protein C [Thermodesulfovibrionales bacterium]|jgi:PRTRC genetic system protein C
MSASVLPRKFKYDHMLLDDLDHAAAPQEVMESYAEIYPALTTAIVDGPEITDAAMVYTFTTRLGTKGTEDDGSIDFSLMQRVADIFWREDARQKPEPLPSEVLEVI